jgi:hypothetical protein
MLQENVEYEDSEEEVGNEVEGDYNAVTEDEVYDGDQTEIIDMYSKAVDSPVTSKGDKRKMMGLEKIDATIAVDSKKIKLESEKMKIPPLSPAINKLSKPKNLVASPTIIVKTPPQSFRSALVTPTQSPRTPSNKKRVSFSPAAELSYASDPVKTAQSPAKILSSSPKVYANNNALRVQLTPSRRKPVSNAQDPIEITAADKPKAKAKLFSESEVAATLIENYDAMCKQVTDPTRIKLRERLLKFYRE